MRKEGGGGGGEEVMVEKEEERARGWQKGEEGRQCARKRAIDSNVGDILRRRDREQWEKEGERQRQKRGGRERRDKYTSGTYIWRVRRRGE